MDSQLKNKLALVTGSTGGIGLAIAKNLALEGASFETSLDEIVKSYGNYLE